MIKKLLAALLAVTMLLCLGACDLSAKDSDETTETTAQTEPDTTAAQEEETEPTAAAVTTPEKKVNTNKLRGLELTDDFPVKVTNTELVSGYFAEGRDMYTTYEFLDGALVTVDNRTSGKITGVSILVLATKEGKEATFNDFSAIITPIGQEQDYSSCVKLMSVSDIELASGESEAYSMNCAIPLFDTLNIIVYSYTDANGNEVINENCYEWLGNTLPVEVN